MSRAMENCPLSGLARSDPRGQVTKTVQPSHDYVAAGGMKPFKSPERPKRLDGLEGWLRERLIRHRDNADVVRQDLLAERRDGQPADAATRRAALSPGAEGGGAGDDAV